MWSAFPVWALNIHYQRFVPVAVGASFLVQISSDVNDLFRIVSLLHLAGSRQLEFGIYCRSIYCLHRVFHWERRHCIIGTLLIWYLCHDDALLFAKIVPIHKKILIRFKRLLCTRSPTLALNIKPESYSTYSKNITYICRKIINYIIIVKELFAVGPLRFWQKIRFCRPK